MSGSKELVLLHTQGSGSVTLQNGYCETNLGVTNKCVYLRLQRDRVEVTRMIYKPNLKLLVLKLVLLFSRFVLVVKWFHFMSQ